MSERSRERKGFAAPWGRIAAFVVFCGFMSPMIISAAQNDRDADVLSKSLAAPIEADGFQMVSLKSANPKEENGWGTDSEFAGNLAHVVLRVSSDCEFKDVTVHFTGNPKRPGDVDQYSFTTYDDIQTNTAFDAATKTEKKVFTGIPVEHTFTNSNNIEAAFGESGCSEAAAEANRFEEYEYQGTS